MSGALTITYNNSSFVPVGAGTYTVGVTFVSGDANYKNASGAGTLLINKANQTATLAGVPAAVTLGEGPFAVSASASSGLPVQITVSGSCSFSGSSLSITGPGACTVSANQGGNSNFNPVPEVVKTFNTVVSWSGSAAADQHRRQLDIQVPEHDTGQIPADGSISGQRQSRRTNHCRESLESGNWI